MCDAVAVIILLPSIDDHKYSISKYAGEVQKQRLNQAGEKKSALNKKNFQKSICSILPTRKSESGGLMPALMQAARSTNPTKRKPKSLQKSATFERQPTKPLIRCEN